jgi:hypothetical protein
MNDNKLSEALYDAYESGYSDPRPLHYSEIVDEFGGGDSISETDAIADAFDLGCRHAESDADQLPKEELLEEMASW